MGTNEEAERKKLVQRARREARRRYIEERRQEIRRTRWLAQLEQERTNGDQPFFRVEDAEE